MLLNVRLSEFLKARVDQLIARGLYSDLSSAVTAALENLLLAEQENGHAPSPNVPAEPKPDAAQRKRTPEPSPATNQARAADTNEAPITSHHPAILNWTEAPALPEQLIVPVPADLFRAGQLVPVERWIFGQQNRVLPAKINTRLFVTLVAARKAEIELFEAASAISAQAVQVFGFLNELDERFGLGKDDQL